MLTSLFLPLSTGDGSTLWDCQVNSIDHDSIFSAFFFYREGGPRYSDLKLSERTMGILVSLGIDFFVEIRRGV